MCKKVVPFLAVPLKMKYEVLFVTIIVSEREQLKETQTDASNK